MMPPPHRHKDENVDAWLMSYADMITLLMCFFIIFVSVSEPKRDKFSEVTKGLANKFGSVDLSTPFQGVAQALTAVIEGQQMLQDVAIDKTEKSVTMELATGAFFKPDSDQFNVDRLPALTDLVNALKKVDYFEYAISIESHTSDAKVNSAAFPSNWELSSARAGRMADFLVQHGVSPTHIRATGMADSQPKVPNLDKKGNPIEENREKNQRLTIKLERAF
jgi:chemotaxis protein MotB